MSSLSAVDFAYLQQFVHERSAILLEADKTCLAELRLSRLLPDTGLESLPQLIDQLRVRPREELERKVVDALTNNETLFFRDLYPFQALQDSILPELMHKRAAEKRISIWSAACSTGQEPYSIAMLLRDRFNLPDWQFSVRATDISSAVLERARNGRYAQMETNRGLPTPLLVRFFQRRGLEWELKPEVRQMVQFSLLNLSTPWPNMPATDVIFMRNVLIYFDLETRRRILAQVRRVLRPDGYLILGGAETTMNIDNCFERVAFEKFSCYKVKD